MVGVSLRRTAGQGVRASLPKLLATCSGWLPGKDFRAGASERTCGQGLRTGLRAGTCWLGPAGLDLPG